MERGAGGGSRGRGSGVGGRGASGSGRGGASARPCANDEMRLTWTTESRVGTPLERPKCTKRRRTWYLEPKVEPECADELPPVQPAAAGLSVGSPAIPPSPALYVECTSSPGPSVAANNHPSPTPGPSGLPSNAQQQQIVEHLALLQAVNPDSGSENDTSSSEDEEGAPLIRSRYDTAADTPLDDAFYLTATTTDYFDSDSASHLPTNMYDFQWNSFPESPIPPESRREAFSENNVGPTTIFSGSYDAFTAIWDRDTMEQIAVQTNAYAELKAKTVMAKNELAPNSRINYWKPTFASELYIYFAIILAMGVVIKTKLTDYWNTTNDIFMTPGFRAYMTRKRFEILSMCLHFNDNEGKPRGLDRAQAKLYKIQPLVTHLNNVFQRLYVLNRNISLDESLLQWKGCLNINQLIPNKKAKIGIKSYEVCESTTGYLWRFEIHAHQKHPLAPGLTAGDPMTATIPSVVLRLVQGLENKGHTIWMDNYYNSPALARKLKSIGFDCVGTLRTNRQYVPEALTNLTKSQMREGQITGFTSGDVDLMVWRDKNRIATISTYHGDSVTNSNGTLKPICITDYNVMMGGVDKKDQMLSSYPIERNRGKVWYKKWFRRALNISVLNSYILLKHSHPTLTHRDFRLDLIRSLLEHHAVGDPVYLPTTAYMVKNHHLSEYPITSGHQHLRRRCVVCKKRVTTFCVGCTKTFCMQPCFVSYHQ